MARHKLKRAGDLTARSKALEEIQDALEPADIAPLRIECYDISNLQGTEIVASMVVFEDGLPRKSEYRRFTIRHEGQSDVAAMHEVITRRLERLLKARADGADETGHRSRDRQAEEVRLRAVADRRRRRTAAGRGRAGGHAASSASTTSPCAGSPSGWRRCGCPTTTTRSSCRAPARGSTCSSGCATRRTGSRSPTTASAAAKAMTGSVLDDVPGLGPTRRRALLKKFGSVKKLRAASVDEVAEVPGIGPATAESIVAALSGDTPAPAVDMATGEILEDR